MIINKATFKSKHTALFLQTQGFKNLLYASLLILLGGNASEGMALGNLQLD